MRPGNPPIQAHSKEFKMSEARSSKNSDFAAEKALVDKAAIAPLPNSEKIYVSGSRSDIQVPMRKITQAETPTDMGGEDNPPIFVYDTSGPYTDPNTKIDIRKGRKWLHSKVTGQLFRNGRRGSAGSELHT